MNDLEKKSFYSFLFLYIISSVIFIFLSSYWYYAAQMNSLESNDYYKLQHIADKVSQDIVSSHMHGKELPPVPHSKTVTVSLIDTKGKLVSGSIVGDFHPDKDGYFKQEKYSSLVSSAPQEHQNIKYVVVQSALLTSDIKELQERVILVMLVVIILVIILAWVFSKLFLSPIHQKIKQIEDFVQNTAHELNTPITALKMSVSRALKKKTYDEKILKNISISTKQLFNIYSALSYLSFESKRKEDTQIDVSAVLQKSVQYYKEISESKRIKINIEFEPLMYKIDEVKLSMLFGNLINNAIKYSMPNSIINISLKNSVFVIEDFGIGIKKEKIANIFKKYNRETDYAGGFGIGLSIVQKICLGYGILIDVESQNETGTRFTLKF